MTQCLQFKLESPDWGFFFDDTKYYIRRMNWSDLPWFYVPEAACDKEILLLKDEAHHLNVLRLSNGERIQVLDGNGALYEAEVTHAKKGLINIHQQIIRAKRTNESTLLVAPTKNMTRFEWIIEKSTEMGISRIMPISCDRSERIQLKTERLIRIAVSAAKQSRDLFIPIIDELQPFEKAIETAADNKWIAHCNPGEKVSLNGILKVKGSSLIAIGPEGDFSTKEIDAAANVGFKPLSLGEKRLRTETAAIAAAMALTLFEP